MRVLSNLYKYKIDDYFNEILIVDNLSTDNTLDNVKEFQLEYKSKIKIIQNKENYNLGGSHKIAFNYMVQNNFDYVMVLHGDDQADVKDIIKFINLTTNNKHDKILGARFTKDSYLDGYSGIRKYGNKVMNLMASVFLGIRMYDLGSGLNMYSKNFANKEFFKKCADDLTFNNHMIFCDKEFKNDVIFIPINWNERDQISNAKLFKQSLEILKLMFRRIIIKTKYFKHKEICKHKSHEYTIISDKKI